MSRICQNIIHNTTHDCRILERKNKSEIGTREVASKDSLLEIEFQLMRGFIGGKALTLFSRAREVGRPFRMSTPRSLNPEIPGLRAAHPALRHFPGTSVYLLSSPSTSSTFSSVALILNPGKSGLGLSILFTSFPLSSAGALGHWKVAPISNPGNSGLAACRPLMSVLERVDLPPPPRVICLATGTMTTA
jgi:hypothetical protein